MNIELTKKADPALAADARDRSDRFRRELTGGIIMLSAGIIALGASAQARIVEAVRAFDDFDDDDPWDCHDVGDLDVELEVESEGQGRSRQLVFFRIDRLDGCDHRDGLLPSGPCNPHLALSIHLAGEWSELGLGGKLTGNKS